MPRIEFKWRVLILALLVVAVTVHGVIFVIYLVLADFHALVLIAAKGLVSVLLVGGAATGNAVVDLVGLLEEADARIVLLVVVVYIESLIDLVLDALEVAPVEVAQVRAHVYVCAVVPALVGLDVVDAHEVLVVVREGHVLQRPATPPYFPLLYFWRLQTLLTVIFGRWNVSLRLILRKAVTAVGGVHLLFIQVFGRRISMLGRQYLLFLGCRYFESISTHLHLLTTTLEALTISLEVLLTSALSTMPAAETALRPTIACRIF